VFRIKGHTFQSNYDGSQDEGEERNEAVLERFFEPFRGETVAGWPSDQTRIIAINEGRLVDFLLEHESEFPLLSRQVQDGLSGQHPQDGVAVINLNLRSVVAGKSDCDSILERMVAAMTKREFWTACHSCDLKGKCYVRHNAMTFQDATAGPKVMERLKTLFAITHLRGRLHITMRDLRSAVAYMLVGLRDCDGIHQLYQQSGENAQNLILDGFYFNSWTGGREGSADRLLALLREIDVAQVSNPELDRALGFVDPAERGMSRFGFGERANYDQELIGALFRSLPRDYTARNRPRLIEKHRNHVSHLRRRHFFERRDTGWRFMLPYASVENFMAAIQNPGEPRGIDVAALIQAINRGEGLTDPDRLGNQLALRVRRVERGTIRSYRLFKSEHFLLQAEQGAEDNPFLESLPQALVLRYDSGAGHRADLRITLDIFEMLRRMEYGYRPSVEEEKGFYLSLAVFKNVLSAAPYQEVLLTESGFDFYRIKRNENGVIHLEKLGRRAEA